MLKVIALSNNRKKGKTKRWFLTLYNKGRKSHYIMQFESIQLSKQSNQHDLPYNNDITTK